MVSHILNLKQQKKQTNKTKLKTLTKKPFNKELKQKLYIQIKQITH